MSKNKFVILILLRYLQKKKNKRILPPPATMYMLDIKQPVCKCQILYHIATVTFSKINLVNKKRTDNDTNLYEKICITLWKL